MKQQHTSQIKRPFMTTTGRLEAIANQLMANEVKTHALAHRKVQIDENPPKLRSLERRLRRSRRIA